MTGKSLSRGNLSLQMTPQMQVEKNAVVCWNDGAIRSSIRRILLLRSKDSEMSKRSSFTHMFGDELEAILAGAIKYMDSIDNNEAEQAEPVSQDRKIEPDLCARLYGEGCK